MREVRTTTLVTGQCRHPEATTILGGTWCPVPFPSTAMLIEHPFEGAILFDTGYDPAFMAATQKLPEKLYRWATPVELVVGQDAASQCRARGIDPETIRHVVLSHFHADHIAGTHAFPNALLYCARAGLEEAWRGGRLAATCRGVLRTLIPPDFTTRARFFEDATNATLPSALAPFSEGADILGDGSLIAVELPGHCPGHWGLVLNDAQWGLHFLVADAAWSLDAIRRNNPPPVITSAFLGNSRRTRETLRRLHQLHLRNPDVRLTPCHCRERAAEVQGEFA